MSRIGYGHHEFTVMSFSLTNTPTAHKSMVEFVDGILIYSKDRDEHTTHLRTVLHTLWEHQLCDKLKKCEFWLEKVLFFGHVVLKKGIKGDPRR